MVAPSKFTVAQKVRLKFTVKDSAGTATDPDTLEVKYKKPDGTVITKTWPTDAEVVKDSTGNFHIDVTGDQEGTWHWYTKTTGAVVAADEGAFVVQNSVFV